jgi:hypothetical protein
MPRRKTKAHDLTTEQALRKMFPKPVREAATSEAQKARKPTEKASTKKDSS